MCSIYAPSSKSRELARLASSTFKITKQNTILVHATFVVQVTLPTCQKKYEEIDMKIVVCLLFEGILIRPKYNAHFHLHTVAPQTTMLLIHYKLSVKTHSSIPFLQNVDKNRVRFITYSKYFFQLCNNYLPFYSGRYSSRVLVHLL